MSRHSMLSSALLLVMAIGCNKETKLQKEVMEDSTWESSSGAEKWEAAEQPPKQDDAWEEENAPMEGAPAKKSEPESHRMQPYPRVSSGSIARDELKPVLDRGLGRFLQNVETQPVFHKGAFVGFRILSLFPGEPTFASLDLRPGDTVTSVNGKPIERPEQAAAVWEDLRTASNLVVDYRRGDQSYALRFAIIDAP
jgi:type II secretory pathway component PulC